MLFKSIVVLISWDFTILFWIDLYTMYLYILILEHEDAWCIQTETKMSIVLWMRSIRLVQCECGTIIEETIGHSSTCSEELLLRLSIPAEEVIFPPPLSQSLLSYKPVNIIKCRVWWLWLISSDQRHVSTHEHLVKLWSLLGHQSTWRVSSKVEKFDVKRFFFLQQKYYFQVSVAGVARLVGDWSCWRSMIMRRWPTMLLPTLPSHIQPSDTINTPGNIREAVIYKPKVEIHHFCLRQSFKFK